jgi:flagellar basal body rod protein FlgF
MTLFRTLAGAALTLTLSMSMAASHAVDFKSVGAAPAILYDAPSPKGGKLFIAPRGMPLEVVLSYGEWVKVRDINGDLAWTEASALTGKRNVVVRSAGVRVRSAADDNAPALFSADKGILLELTEPAANGWLKVRHKDGLTGYIKATDVWGN